MTEQPTVTMNLSPEQSAAINHWIAHEHGPDRMDVIDQVYVRQLLVEHARRPLTELGWREGEDVRAFTVEFERRCNEAIDSARELGIFMSMMRFGLSIEEVQELVRASDRRVAEEPGP